MAEDVREVAERLQSQAQELRSDSNEEPQPQASVIAPVPRSSNLRIKRTYDDHEKDQFLEDSYEYIARYFDGSLEELQA